MPAPVSKRIPGAIVRTGIVSDAPVRGSQMMSIGDACNYLLGGRCRAIIPPGGGGYSIPANTTRTLRYRIWPSYQATHRVWVAIISAGADDELGPTSVTFTDPSSTTSLWAHPASTADAPRAAFRHIETISSRTSTETAIAPTLAVASTSAAALVHSLACYEIRRPDLAIDASDLGVEIRSLEGGATIHDGVGRSVGGLPEAVAGALAMRRTLFQFAIPSADAADITGTGTALLSYNPPQLDRFLYTGETQVTITAWVYTRSGAGTTGTVDFTMTNGDTLSIAVSAADAGTWRSGSIDIDAEDLSATDGRRSTRFDFAAITASRTAGSNGINVDSISIAGRAG